MRSAPKTLSATSPSASSVAVNIPQNNGRQARILYAYGSVRVSGAGTSTQAIIIGNSAAPGADLRLLALGAAGATCSHSVGDGGSPLTRPPTIFPLAATQIVTYQLLIAAGTAIVGTDLSLVVVYDYE